MGVPSPILKPHDRYLALGRTAAARRERYRSLFKAGFPEAELMRIRRAIVSGDAIGSDDFIARVETMVHGSLAAR